MPVTITTYKNHKPALTEYLDYPHTMPKAYARLPQERFVGVSTISFPNKDKSRTTMAAMESSKWSDLPVPTAYVSNFEEMLDVLSDYFWVEEENPSDTAPRGKRLQPKRGREYKSGRRQYVPPVVLLFHRLEDDVMNIFGSDERFERLLMTGREKPVDIPIGKRTAEISDWHPNGSAPSFEFYIRWDGHWVDVPYKNGAIHRQWSGKIMRIIGRDIWAYLKEKLLDCADAFLKDVPLTELPKSWLERYYKSFEPEELELIKKYLAQNAHAIRLLYDELMKFLIAIKPAVTDDGQETGIVITRSGLLPKSVASASMRIATSLSDKAEWYLPPKWAMQMGSLTSAGSRIFCVKPGEYEGINEYDITMMEPWLYTIIPSPTIPREDYKRISEQPFIVDDWKGKWGNILISGHAPKLPKAYRAIRVHNPITERLDYIEGDFEQVWTTIPEAVIGVLSGRLQITQIHDGCLIDSTSYGSYMAAFAYLMYQLRNQFPAKSLQYNLIKQLAVSPSGKSQETNKNHQFIDPRKGFEPIPRESLPFYLDVEEAYINGEEPFRNIVREINQQAREPDNQIRFFEAVQYNANYSQQAGAYYNPVYGSQIKGAGSAILGLFAYHTNAPYGNCDGLFTIGDQTKGFQISRQIMREAGYPMPETGLGAFKRKAENASGNLVMGGLFFIEWDTIDRETGEVEHHYKDAKHNLIQRGNKPAKDLIKEFLRKGHITYQTDAVTLRYKQALQQKAVPGTRKSRTMTLTQPSSDDLNQLTTLSPFQDRILQDANRYLANSALKKT
jgi:hypothetical protein